MWLYICMYMYKSNFIHIHKLVFIVQQALTQASNKTFIRFYSTILVFARHCFRLSFTTPKRYELSFMLLQSAEYNGIFDHCCLSCILSIIRSPVFVSLCLCFSQSRSLFLATPHDVLFKVSLPHAEMAYAWSRRNLRKVLVSHKGVWLKFVFQLYVWVYMYIQVHLYTGIYSRISFDMINSIYIYVLIYKIYIFIYMYTGTDKEIFILCDFICIHVYINRYTFLYLKICMYIYIRILTYKHTYEHIYKQLYIHIYTYIYMYMCICCVYAYSYMYILYS
jgi:hypothetical protein